MYVPACIVHGLEPHMFLHILTSTSTHGSVHHASGFRTSSTWLSETLSQVHSIATHTVLHHWPHKRQNIVYLCSAVLGPCPHPYNKPLPASQSCTTQFFSLDLLASSCVIPCPHLDPESWPQAYSSGFLSPSWPDSMAASASSASLSSPSSSALL